MLDVSTPKMNYPDCPFNSSQRQVNISIFTPRCEVCLCVVMHTEETYVLYTAASAPTVQQLAKCMYIQYMRFAHQIASCTLSHSFTTGNGVKLRFETETSAKSPWE